jgi:hypothetical protein
MGINLAHLLYAGSMGARVSIQLMLDYVEAAIAERSIDFEVQADEKKERVAYRLLRVRHGVAWLLPDSYESAKFVYDNWNSYGRLSRLMLPILKTTHKYLDSTALIFLPKIEMSLPPFFQESPIYLSIEGNRARALAILRKDGEAVEILKVPGSAADKISFEREYENLLNLSPLQIGAPRAIWQNQDSGAFSQEFLKGKASAPKFTQKHLEFLLKLRQPGFEIISPASASVSAFTSSTDSSSYFIHGDFAPWNMKFTEQGRLAVFDWEYGCNTGAPGIDLAYYFLSLFSYLKDTAAFEDWIYWSECYWGSLQLGERINITAFRHQSLIDCLNYLQENTKDQLLIKTCEAWMKKSISQMEIHILAGKLPD